MPDHSAIVQLIPTILLIPSFLTKVIHIGLSSGFTFFLVLKMTHLRYLQFDFFHFNFLLISRPALHLLIFFLNRVSWAQEGRLWLIGITVIITFVVAALDLLAIFTEIILTCQTLNEFPKYTRVYDHLEYFNRRLKLLVSDLYYVLAIQNFPTQ